MQFTRPVQDLDEWSAVYTPVLPAVEEIAEQLYRFIDDKVVNRVTHAQNLRNNKTYYASLYSSEDIFRMSRLCEMVISEGQPRLTLDDVAHLWWMRRIADFIQKPTTTSDDIYSFYLYLTNKLKPFIIGYKKDATRHLLTKFTTDIKNV